MFRIFSSEFRDRGRRKYPDPFPVEVLKRVDRPTTLINDGEVRRSDEREHGFARARRGDFGPKSKREVARFAIKEPLSATLSKLTHFLSGAADGPLALKTAPMMDDPVKTARLIKETAYFLRADVVGICELPPYAVYSHRVPDGEPVELKHKYAIAVLIDQDSRTCRAFGGHDWISGAMSFLGYSNSAFIACIIADYIRHLGYPARPHFSQNYQVLVPPVLLWAGLGEMCRIGGVVLNPFLGPRFKAAVVTTDLPLAIDKPIDFGLQDFCKKCAKCAQYCHSGAIQLGGTAMHNGYEHWPYDVEKCTSFRVGNQQGASCGTCIKSCPWSKPFTPFHRMVMWSMRNLPFTRRLAIWGDDLIGYHKPNPDLKWWRDFEEVEGELRIPTRDRDTKP
ncbi:MAG: reductive dehalogenase [Desulfatiglandales bacterium]|nr:reductive dehalogenase [Desulfatiglandales bacterium]